MCKHCQPHTSGILAPVIQAAGDATSLNHIRDVIGDERDHLTSLKPRSPLSSDDGGIGDVGASTSMPPSQPAWPPGRVFPVLSIRRRSHGDEGGVVAIGSQPRAEDWSETERRRTCSGERPGKRRRGERSGRSAGAQEKITQYFSKHVKRISPHVFHSVQKSEDVMKPVVPSGDGGYVQAAAPGDETEVVSPFTHPERVTTLHRAPSEASSVDSGLGSLSTPGTPCTPGEALSAPGTPREAASEAPTETFQATAPVLRFPACRPVPSALTCCQWLDCGDRLSSPTKLLDHLQSQHIAPQREAGRRCLWQGCKVYNRPGSAAWLERHVLSHAGRKPYRCIVDGCSHRFSSQTVLERHVNGHFAPATPAKRPDCFSKLSSRRTGRRSAPDDHPFSARIVDFCDASVMERLRFQLVAADGALSRLAPVAGRALQLTAQVIARRLSCDKGPELLVQWLPPDVVDDEWVQERLFQPTRHVPCSQLPLQVAARVANAVGHPPPRRYGRKTRPP